MPDYTVKWPLELNQISNGFTPINRDNLKEVAIFNLKNIILTIPGERIMVPEFGVGVKNYLFELDTSVDIESLKSRINSQVQQFASYIQLMDIQISMGENSLDMRIKFAVPSADIIDQLELSVEL